MANVNDLYVNLTLSPEGFFKTSNNRLLGFTFNDVKNIYKQLMDDVDFKDFIRAGVFNEYLNIEDEVLDDEINTGVNINDIYITINNYPVSTIENNKPINNNKPVNNKRLREWSRKIRKRDNYTCSKCGKVDTEHSQAHHIFPKSRYPSLACDEGNGITLCQKCHSIYHNQYKSSENAYNLYRWLNEY